MVVTVVPLMARMPLPPQAAYTTPVALSWDLPLGLPFDERETVTGAWDYPPGAKLDRLLRHTGVPIGLLSNGTHLRLMYTPHGASTGSESSLPPLALM